MLDNQTPEFFQDVNKPKYNGTLNLDRWAPPFSSPGVWFIPQDFGRDLTINSLI